VGNNWGSVNNDDVAPDLSSVLPTVTRMWSLRGRISTCDEIAWYSDAARTFKALILFRVELVEATLSLPVSFIPYPNISYQSIDPAAIPVSVVTVTAGIRYPIDENRVLGTGIMHSTS
jgi:hypothetical protein